MASTMSDCSHISSVEVPGISVSEAFLMPYKQREGLPDNWFRHRQQLEFAIVCSVLTSC